MDRKEAQKRAEELVGRMTADEMCSQLRFNAPAIERLGIPAYNWWNEALHGTARAGTATVFPQAIGLGASFDTEMMHEIGNCVGTETRAKYNEAVKQGDRDIYKGITVWAPNVNIFRDPRWGRGQETLGEDPILTGSLGASEIEGLQGDGEYLLTASCAKHFAVHSGPEAERHRFNAVVSKKDLWETYLPAFEKCVKEAHVESVMGAYNRTNGEPCCASKYLMQEVLRGKWGFQGFYISDCWALRDFHEEHKITKDAAHSAKLALETGCDLNCGCTYLVLRDALGEHLISKETVREAAVRLFTARMLLGMFDHTPFDSLGIKDVDTPEHRALASRAARESCVLLKNDGILPLDRHKVHSVAVIGPNADSRPALIGNYHGTSPQYITVLDGIEAIAGEQNTSDTAGEGNNACGGIAVRYAQGCHLYKDRVESLAQGGDRIAEAVTLAENSDVTVLCLGLDETLEGEEGDTGNSYASGDRESLALPAPQVKLLEAVAGTGRPFILCNMTGSPVDLCFAEQHAAAILQVWYPGGRGGLDVARILFGDESPSGKLPITFPRDLEGYPAFTDYAMKGRTYRYLEKEPLYPFGFGLNYGSCEVTDVKNITLEGIGAAGGEAAGKAGEAGTHAPKGIVLCVTAVNRGTRNAEEVLQIYGRTEGAAGEVRNTRLIAFTRLDLAAGESCEVNIELPENAALTVGEDGEYVREGTALHLYAGFGQPDARTFELTGVRDKEILISL
ncbi:MAG: glycoside hydrolase family 3 C-terminal domain-containing protein [Lachnospiraceae bacterium]|jgi:beta-glucosidase|nr:glycoside hydrolase family 3 C-terminal domain-containing protein [Lachnospiraceae bacterium]